jgi:amino acid permease
MSVRRESLNLAGKGLGVPSSIEPLDRGEATITPIERVVIDAGQNPLHRNLKGRHMQMIAMQVFS